ncbi:MAG: ABC transporter permease [Bacteroidales bacterium]
MSFTELFKKVFKREWRRFSDYPIFITLSLILPLISFLLFVLIFQTGVPRDLPVAVMNEDASDLSRKLVRMIDATPSVKIIQDISDPLEGERLMKEGKIDAFIIIPDGFERLVLRNEQATVNTFISGTNLTKNGLLDKDIRTTVMTFSSGIQIQLLMKAGLSEKEAYVQMMPVTFEKHVLFNPFTNYSFYLLPAFLPMMMIVFILISTIFAIGVELKNGTAGEWMEVAGGNVLAALWGKLLPYMGLHMVLWCFMNVIIYKYEQVPLNGSALFLFLAGFLFLIAYQSVGILIITLLSNLRLALSLGGGYSVLAFTFSGLTFPFMAMDPAIRMFGKIFPFTYYMEIFLDQAIRGADVSYSWHYLIGLGVFILLPYLFLSRLKKITTDPAYWNKY